MRRSSPLCSISRSGALHARHAERGGALLLSIMFFFGISIAILLSATTSVITELRTYRALADSKSAFVIAEAGIEDGLYRAEQNMDISATEIYALNGATGTLTYVDLSDTEQFYQTVGIANGRVRKLTALSTKNVDGALYYGAQVGEGGIIMRNNSLIDGTGLIKGRVHSNGQIDGEPAVTITGDVTIASGIIADTTSASLVCAADVEVGRSNPTVDHAQSFIASTTAALPKVSLYIKRVGNPNNANLRIAEDNGSGSPKTTSIAVQSLPYASADTNYGWVEVEFTSPPTLTGGQTYWIILDADQHSGKYWYWCRDTANAYANGSPKYKQDWSSGSGSWTAIAGDLDFQVYYGGGKSQLDEVIVSGTAKADSIMNSQIGVDAYYQTITSTTVTGASYPGSPTPPPVPLPYSTTLIGQWKSDAEAGGTITGTCGSTGVAGCNNATTTMGPRKIDGDLVLNNNEEWTISGTLWVTGNIDLSNNSVIRCHASYAASSCIIIADGWIEVGNNVILSGSGTAGSYVMLLTTIAGCIGPGSPNLDCANNESAIRVSNNGQGALFYSTAGQIFLSNNVIVTAIVGYKLELSNLAQIIYDDLVQQIHFAPTATSSDGAWSVDEWREE
ncbi:MAG TPA: choice-of-anchor R domain-containing protein [Candidatus Paceibacterota bacterium]|nr:choice-of-anchor R domain-containing protein [Candidatus Paceibacterota bacterium]